MGGHHHDSSEIKTRVILSIQSNYEIIKESMSGICHLLSDVILLLDLVFGEVIFEL